ncbi:MAG TPA: ADP-ribosylglycohydrolase family protein, partial [Myxococcaceae bacterium]|nr:ADP-ribosylglycohydrolase family protein [Myxococcaceae bacterium]
MRRDAIAGALLGTLVADALGLPREGLSPQRALRLFGGAPLRHRLFLGRGVGSDDTEHA